MQFQSLEETCQPCPDHYYFPPVSETVLNSNIIPLCNDHSSRPPPQKRKGEWFYHYFQKGKCQTTVLVHWYWGGEDFQLSLPLRKMVPVIHYFADKLEKIKNLILLKENRVYWGNNSFNCYKIIILFTLYQENRKLWISPINGKNLGIPNYSKLH